MFHLQLVLKTYYRRQCRVSAYGGYCRQGSSWRQQSQRLSVGWLVRISAPSLRQQHRLERKFGKVQSFHSILLHALEQDIESIKFFNQYFEQSLLCLEHCESASIRSKSWFFKKNVKTKEGSCRICCCAEVFVSGSYYLYLLC